MSKTARTGTITRVGQSAPNATDLSQAQQLSFPRFMEPEFPQALEKSSFPELSGTRLTEALDYLSAVFYESTKTEILPKSCPVSEKHWKEHGFDFERLKLTKKELDTLTQRLDQLASTNREIIARASDGNAQIRLAAQQRVATNNRAASSFLAPDETSNLSALWDVVRKDFDVFSYVLSNRESTVSFFRRLKAQTS